MKTPAEYAASGSEHAEQVALFMWAQAAATFGYAAADDPLSYSVPGHALTTYGRNGVTELNDLFAIPNGGARGDDAKTRMIRGGQLKSEGVKPGVLDIMLPIARGGFYGLFIELKRRSTGKGKARRQKGSTTDVQDDWIARLRRNGYGAATCVGFEEAKACLIAYLAQEKG